MDKRQLPVDTVVFDEKDTKPLFGRTSIRREGSGLQWGLTGFQWQMQRERGTASRLAGDSDVSAHKLGEHAGDRQPQAGARIQSVIATIDLKE